MSNTTVCKQSFQISLCQRRNSSNDHRKSSKKCQCTSKISFPNSMPMMSPESKNRNFWQKCNPQRYTRPCSSINIRNPKMQRSCCEFPKQTCCNLPNTKQKQQRRIFSCSSSQAFNMRQICFSCLPIDKTNSLKQQTASKCAQLEIFHCSFKRIGAFRIQAAKNNKRKTLLFQCEIQGHLVSCLNLQILSNQSLHCLINIFGLTNSCNFLPSKCYSQNKSTCCLQQNTQRQTVCILCKCSSQYNCMQGTFPQKKNSKSTPSNSPLCLCSDRMVWTSCRCQRRLLKHSSFLK